MDATDIVKIVLSLLGALLILRSGQMLTNPKTKSRWALLTGLIGVAALASLFFLINKDTHTALNPKPVVPQKPKINFTGYSPEDKTVSCPTSKATGATATTVFEIKELKTDGKSDNFDAIQAAIDEAGAAGGGIVKLPAGTFILNGHLVMRDNVTLSGAGPKTILKAGPDFIKNDVSEGYSIVATEGANDVTIEHLLADHQGHILDGNSINRFFGYIIHVHNSKNVRVNDVYTRNPFTYAIVAEDSEQFCFTNNNTRVGTDGKYDQLDGIHVLDSSFGDVINNYVDQGYGKDGDDALVAHTIGGKTHDVLYAKNKVRGGKGGSGMQLALTEPTDEIYNITIQNNEFWGSPRGIRTGYYGGKDGSVHDILIGGNAKQGNYIHDNIFNNYNLGDSINIYGNGIDPYNITVSNNYTCNAGIISVGKGENNKESKNVDCKLKSKN